MGTGPEDRDVPVPAECGGSGLRALRQLIRTVRLCASMNERGFMMGWPRWHAEEKRPRPTS